MKIERKLKKYLKYSFETPRTIVFSEYYFFYKPEDEAYFPEELLYFLFLSKNVVILRKNNEMRLFGPRIRKYGIKNLRIIQNEDEFN